MPSSPHLGRTVGDDPQGLFKQHREQELEERRKLYRSAPDPSRPQPPRDRPGAPDPFLVPTSAFTSLHRWGNWKDGLILNMAGAKISDLPVDERFLEDKKIDFEASLAKG